MLSSTDIHHDIVDRCREGDRRAQYELYSLYAKPMLNVAMRIVNDRMEAEDVLQESFINAFGKLRAFRGESTIGAWIKRIVVNKSLNVVKKRRVYFDNVDDHQISEEEAEDDQIQYNVKDIHRALTELPEGYRLVFTLYMFEDQSHAEIAESLGITENTSKSQLSRARRKIKEIMIKNKHDEEG